MKTKLIVALTVPAILSAAGVALAAPAAAVLPGSGYKVLSKIVVPDGGGDYLSVDAFNKRVLVTKGATIMSIDTATGEVTPKFATALGSHGAVAVDGGKQVAITNGGNNSVSFVDSKTGAAIASAPAPSFPDAVGVDPTTGMVLAASHSSGVLTVIDPSTHAVAGSVTIGGTLEGVAGDGAGRAYVNIEDKGAIAVVDLKTYKLVTTYAMAGCEGPTGIIYDATSKLLVSACDALAEVVDAATGKIVASIKTGAGADMAGFYAADELAFIPAAEDGTLAIISLKGGKPVLLDNVPTQIGARAVAVDPATGRAYLPVSDTAAAAAGGRRGASVPGSFKVLVVGK